MASLWTRIKERLARWLRREPAPGRYVESAKWSWRGFLAGAPLVLPRRKYLVYVPRGHSRWRRAPLVVLCHGCKQTAEAFAQGTRIAALADRLGCLVLLPKQGERANPWCCWNWFDPATARGAGEAAIVAAMTTRVRRRYRADPARVIVAGMSAGAALASVLGVRHPSLFRGVVVHSGLACGAATSALTALSVMGRGPETDVAATARAARSDDTCVPLLAIHGLGDNVVAPRNAAAAVRQYLALAGVDVPAGAASTLPDADGDARHDESGRAVRIREWRRGPRLLARLVEIESLGHAWSGGDATLAYNDAAPPDATALIGAFIGELPQ